MSTEAPGGLPARLRWLSPCGLKDQALPHLTLKGADRAKAWCVPPRWSLEHVPPAARRVSACQVESSAGPSKRRVAPLTRGGLPSTGAPAEGAHAEADDDSNRVRQFLVTLSSSGGPEARPPGADVKHWARCPWAAPF